MIKGKIFLAVLPLFALISCVAEHSKIIVAEYDGENIKMEEFENAYAHDQGGIEKVKTDSVKSYEKFLDLYVDYKMKLRDALERGLPSDKKVQKEFDEYKIAIGSSVYLENTLNLPNMLKIYEEMKTEYKIGQIRITADSAKHMNQAEELGYQLIQRIKNGEDFASLAKKYSKDEASKIRGGIAGYVTGGYISNPDLENALNTTEPGQVYPRLLKSIFGYHVIKVFSKRPRRPPLSLAQIFIATSDSSGKQDTVKALKKALDVEKRIKNGEKFGDLAQKYSDDKKTSKNNGELGAGDTGGLDYELADAAYNMKKGEVSKIIRTPAGYYIIKLLDELPYPTFDQLKDNIRDFYKAIHYSTDYSNLIAELRSELKYVVNTVTLNNIFAKYKFVAFNQAYWDSDLRKEFGTSGIFSINGKSYPADSLFSYIVQQESLTINVEDIKSLIEKIDDYSAGLLIKEKAANYDRENADYAKMLDNYRNGIYIYRILDDEVWSKIALDTLKIKSYYNKNRENYKWGDRVELKEIFCKNDSILNKCVRMIKAGLNYDVIRPQYNQISTTKDQTSLVGLVDVNTNEITKQASALKNVGDVSNPFPYENGWAIVKLVGREPARLKTFEESKSDIGDLIKKEEAKRLEDEYLAKLKIKYKPELYKNELRKAFKPAD